MKPHTFPLALTNLPLFNQGKTRDTFELPDGNLLIVATNRLSTHNIVHESPVVGKRDVLTAMTIFWLTKVLTDTPHHLVAYGSKIYDHLPNQRAVYPGNLHRYSIVVKKLQMIPVEFIYRNFLTGSIFDKFYSKGLNNPYGISLPHGLQQMAEFSLPLFTPTDKSETDEPLNSEEVMQKYHAAYRLGLDTFRVASIRMQGAGMQLVDSKFELGVDSSGTLCLADEIVTPDSSRFCEERNIKLGYAPPWLDKQIARDEAVRIWGNEERSPIKFDSTTLDQMSRTYRLIFNRVTSMSLEDFQDSYMS